MESAATEERSRASFLGENEKVKSLKKDFKYSMRSLANMASSEDQPPESPTQAEELVSATTEPVNVEYESNRICLAFWRKNSKHDNNEYEQSIDDYDIDDNEYGYGECNGDYHDF